jgi:aspartyl/glutamyl-tRNA(Asn/Gln) amidotransferase C subunit
MSTNEDIKKLCILSRLEMDDYERGQTVDKIKEIISFFNKLDEFDLSGNADNSMVDNNNRSKDEISNGNRIADTFIQSEKKFEDLREDASYNVLDNIQLANKSNSNINPFIHQFEFTFRHQKNGFIIGPKI